MSIEINIFKSYASGTLDGKRVMTEDDFNKMISDGLATPARLEHIEMKIMYRELRKAGIRAGDAIDKVRDRYSHLQFDTIRKIVYNNDVRQG